MKIIYILYIFISFFQCISGERLFPDNDLRNHYAVKSIHRRLKESAHSCNKDISEKAQALCILKGILTEFITTGQFSKLPTSTKEQMTTILLTSEDGKCMTYNSSLNPYPRPVEIGELKDPTIPTLVVDCSDGELKVIPKIQKILVGVVQQIDFSNVRVFNLSGNAIEQISNGVDDSFLHLTGLRHLVLSNNNLKTINNNAFLGMKELVALEVANNQISLLKPQSFQDLSQLKALTLAGNYLDDLTFKTMENLPQLSHLDLYDNEFSKIGNIPFLAMRRLKVLMLDYNKISTISITDFSGASTLSHLTLSNNKISVIPENSFIKLVQLSVLDLSNNNLEVIHAKNFNGISRLERLYLRNNKIKILHPASFQGVRSIADLRLDGNEITKLDGDLFKETSNIFSLNFARNKIIEFHPDTFTPILTLVELDLTFNRLTDIPIHAFDGLNSLRYLNLKNNNINDLDPELFKTLELQMSSTGMVLALDQFHGCTSGYTPQPVNGNNVCVACQPGYYSNSGQKCLECPPNTFTDLTGQAACKICPNFMQVSPHRDECSPTKCDGPCIASLVLGVSIPFLVAFFSILLLCLDAKNKKNVVREQALSNARKEGWEQANKERIHIKADELNSMAKILATDQHLQRSYIPYEKLTEGKLISSGSFGEVLSGFYCGGKVAIKRLLPQRLSKNELVMFAKEIQLMTNLRHPNIVQFIGVSWSSCYNICAVTEFLDRGDLYGLLRDENLHLTWYTHMLRMSIDAALGLAYLHAQDKPIIHRDLKSRNILVTDSFNCKLSDFGLSREQDVNNTMTAAGTNLWISPEMIRGERFNEKTDCFSFGIVLTEFDSHKTPYHDVKIDGEKITGMALTHHIERGLRPTITERCPASIRNLIVKCTKDNYNERPSASDIVRELQTIVADEISRLKEEGFVFEHDGVSRGLNLDSDEEETNSKLDDNTNVKNTKDFQDKDFSIRNLKTKQETKPRKDQSEQHRLSALLWE